ncbi:MAG: helix-turn-helix domain-containing protein [Oscillospiraceae bacterium]|nr:helix-turn-helix domain-containing protein [Oscillospiraceae bacterium]
MSKRKYTHIKEVESQIIAMREAGKTRQEIADELGLEKVQIKAWVTRYNRRKKELQQGIPPKPKGRRRQKPLSSAEEYEREISRLQMENKLLRDFLESTERM